MSSHSRGMSATYVPGGFDDYYVAPAAPELLAPEPQRINPEMSNQIQDGMHHMNLNGSDNTLPADLPHLTPFPKLVNPPPNIPPSDEQLEATLENARTVVLNSNDADMQLAWAADALVYVGVCTDNEERIAAARPQATRPKTPRIEHQLKTDAMNIVTFLADQHHPKAEFLRGMWLEWGRFGQREDKKEAFRCYSRAADREYARAEYRIGMLYESYNDPIKALRHYHRGIDAGDAASYYRLGMMTLRGQHGQPQDFAKGLDLIRKSAQAADENAAQGAYVYGMLLARQLPQVEVPESALQYDERGARINIEKAAYLKFAKAQLKMGSCYELGSLGCEFSPALSMHYYALSSKQGEAEADLGLSKWFLVGSEGLFPKNEELAFTYAERAAQSGLPTAEFAMGYFHEIGMHVPVDLDKALEWYQKASKHGNGDAQRRIDGLARKQVLSKKDHENVAITRIKSQYGSMRGARPERFEQRQQAPSRLGQSMTVEETSGYGNGRASPTPPRANGMRLSASYNSYVQPPSRESTTTPYPIDNRPPTVAPLETRPGSVVPYPLEDGPPGPPMLKPAARLGPTGGFFNTNPPPRPATAVNPDMRPSSAFQLNPELRSSSASTVPQLPSQGGRQTPYPPSPHNPAQNSRPMMPMQAQQGSYGLAPGMRPTAGRIASGPAGMQNYSGPAGPRPAPSPGPPTPQPGKLAHAPTAPAAQPLQKLDIGFSAPAEARGHRYGPPQPQPGGGQPASPTAAGRSGSMPNFDQPLPLPPTASGGSGGGGGRISRPGSRPQAESRPSGATLGGGGGGGAPRPPIKDRDSAPAPSSLPVTTMKPKPNQAPPPAQGKPVTPGKGPKTFDEMGVPAQTKDSDCAVM
ncbi:hypothetical protein LTR12_000562 [Friedmanniomyces endolithicus]|nr:hypothetical protein LTR12_000562 [Friedmanniomyces endolithicus]